MLASTLDIGMSIFKLKERIARVINTKNVTNAAFSKSVI